jgi:hypothetical protein
MTSKETIQNLYRVFFLGVPTHSQEDIVAASAFEAVAVIASRYGLARCITAHWIETR